MAWIESHQELADHPKTKRLMRLLALDRYAVIGCLHVLWYWALDYADDGNLDGFSDEDIADGIGWERDAKELVAALIAAGFIDADRTIHDWDDFAGRYVAKRQANAERMRAARAAESAPQPSPNGTRAAHVQRTSSARAMAVQACTGATVPNSTGEDSTEPESTEEDTEACAAPAAVSVPDPVDWVWDFYKSEIQPEARVCPREKIRTRLKRFHPDELTLGIQHFRDDAWCMEHNRSRGGAWFFHDDNRSEHFLTMEPRAAPSQHDAWSNHG